MLLRSTAVGGVLCLALCFNAWTKSFSPLGDRTVAYFGFENSVDDLSGNKNNGTITNTEYVPGYNGQGIMFSGNGYVKIPSSDRLAFTGELTVEMWIKQTDRRFADMYLLDIANGAIAFYTGLGGGLRLKIKSPDGKILDVRGGTEKEVLFMDRWLRIAFALGNGKASLFINGSEVGRLEFQETQNLLQPTSGDIYIGNAPDGEHGFRGIIDEVRISNDISPTTPSLDVDLISFPAKGILKVAANISGMKNPIDNPRAFSILKNGDQPRKAWLSDFRNGKADGIIPVGDLKPGEYPVEVCIEDRTGNRVTSFTSNFAKLGIPKWEGTHQRLTEGKVLPPWTHLKVEEKSIFCWGRTYTFSDNSLFPTEIITDGRSILSSPVRLIGKIGQRTIHFQATDFSFTKISEDKIKAISFGESEGISANAELTIEYDGFIRVDLSVRPSSLVVIDELFLEIPLKKQYAKYFHYVPASEWSSKSRNAGSVPEEGMAFFFKPYVWLGDEDRGICWVSDSYQGWGIDKNKMAVEIQPAESSTTLKISFFNTATALNGPWKTTFGIEATPVKPRPKGWRQWRLGGGKDVNIQLFWANPDYVKWYFFPEQIDLKKYNDLIASYHQQNQKFTNYSSFQFISPGTKEWRYYKGDWNKMGVAAQSDVIRFNEPVMPVCQKSKLWWDYFGFLYERYFHETIADGIYIDNCVPSQCKNPDHDDCYFIDKDGNKQLKWDIFEAREVLKGVYAAAKKAGSDKIIVCHMSTLLVIPLLAFSDAYVDGEQFWSGETFDGNYIKAISLDHFKAEFTGRQAGLVDFFLPELHRELAQDPKYTETLLTLLVLHDAALWRGPCNIDAVSQMWNAMDKFGMEDAEFIPYWNNQQYVQGGGESVKISIYYHQGKDVMLAVGNLSEKPQKAAISCSLQSLGIQNGKAINLKSGESLSQDNGSWIVDIPAENYMLIHIR